MVRLLGGRSRKQKRNGFSVHCVRDAE